MGNLSRKVLDELSAIYEKGSRVSAVLVGGIPEGARGNVLTVMKNGDVKVEFDNIGEITVKYPDEIIRVIHNGCILGAKRGTKRFVECNDDCSVCGWNPSVEKKRKKAIENGELVRGSGGIKRLVLHRQ